MGFPREGEHALHVSFEERDSMARWIRDFGGTVFASEPSLSDDSLVEWFGPMRSPCTIRRQAASVDVIDQIRRKARCYFVKRVLRRALNLASAHEVQ
ncbi:hypothetical protein [Rhizobium mayense]|uniref:Transposase n=1 Tax=Rhizobium mayense TaxID=1312184 RepID=A0ABT7K1D2_9HYPH|nr:hypothetical protein [Rhizobium mayense]MDL2401957.1 hypothetical protein [Rhizobium mayense]